MAGRATEGAAEDVGGQDGEHDRMAITSASFLGSCLISRTALHPKSRRSGGRSGTAGRPAEGEQATAEVGLRRRGGWWWVRVLVVSGDWAAGAVGEGEERLVQAGLADSDLGDRHPGIGEPGRGMPARTAQAG